MITRTYSNPGWQVIDLGDVFKNINSDDALIHIRHDYIPWCKENLPRNTWEWNGATKHSWRVQFQNSEDATAFKLKFNV